MSRWTLSVVAVLALAGLSAPASAQAPQTTLPDYEHARESRRLRATKASAPVVLDGRLDEAAWADAPVASGFVQNDPREGQAATFDTEVRVLYDADALYLGVFAKDDQPGALIVNELRKDFNTSNGDTFQVVIDTFHDGRNGYQFATNPAGAKWDAQMSNEGRETNSNWDGIWDVSARVSAEGWYAEIRIPFRTMKFSALDIQTWGINFQRRNRRLNENSYWSPLPRIHTLSRVSLAGTLEDLEGLEAGRNVRLKPYALASASTAGGRTDGDGDAGFDVKLGVTSGLTLDATVNTDFSQVEADEQQINLTRFSLFFPEKREFFLENSGVFQFGAGSQRGGGGGGGGGGGRQNPSQDMILFFSRTIGLSEGGESLPILAGSRLTGRAGAYSVGALNVQQRRTDEVAATNFTALRLRRDVLAASDVGVMFLNKDGATTNRAFGADANFRFLDDLQLNLAVAKTASPQSVEPGAGRDWYTKTGFAYRSPRLELRGAYQTIGERFNAEMGFVPRRGVSNGELFIGGRFRPTWARRWLRETYPHWQIENFARQSGGGLESRYMDWHLPFTFQDSSFVEVGVNPNVEVIREPFPINRRRGIEVQPGRYEFNENFVLWNSNSSRPVSVSTRYATGHFYDGRRRGYTLGTTLRPSAHFNLAVSGTVNDIDLPAGAFRTTLVTMRVNYYLNTKVFVNALVQYNTDARQWSSNLRLNIIHRPLSDIFIVYNERRDSRSGDLVDRAVVAKMTYLVAF